MKDNIEKDFYYAYLNNILPEPAAALLLSDGNEKCFEKNKEVIAKIFLNSIEIGDFVSISNMLYSAYKKDVHRAIYLLRNVGTKGKISKLLKMLIIKDAVDREIVCDLKLILYKDVL